MNSYCLIPSSALSPPGLFSPDSGGKDAMSVCPGLLSCFRCVRLCNPIDCSPPGSSLHGNSPGKNTEWVVMPSPPGDLPHPGIEPASLMSPALADGFFTTSHTWEAPHMQSTSFKMPGWLKHKLELRLLGEIATISYMQVIPP